MSELLLIMGVLFLLIMGGLCVILLYKVATNQINLCQLLNEANGDASMSRFQLLVFTLIVAAGIFLCILKNTASPGDTTLPEVPSSILILLGISASTYAASKGISFSRVEGVLKQPKTTPPAEPKHSASLAHSTSLVDANVEPKPGSETRLTS